MPNERREEGKRSLQDSNRGEKEVDDPHSLLKLVVVNIGVSRHPPGVSPARTREGLMSKEGLNSVPRGLIEAACAHGVHAGQAGCKGGTVFGGECGLKPGCVL